MASQHKVEGLRLPRSPHCLRSVLLLTTLLASVYKQQERLHRQDPRPISVSYFGALHW
jgi:hypothetical protein